MTINSAKSAQPVYKVKVMSLATDKAGSNVLHFTGVLQQSSLGLKNSLLLILFLQSRNGLSAITVDLPYLTHFRQHLYH